MTPRQSLSACCVALLFLAAVAMAQSQVYSVGGDHSADASRGEGTAPSALLANISTRMRVETGDNVLIAGFIISGTAPKKVLVRAVGPTLTNYGVAGALADPVLQLFEEQTSLGFNDNWKDSPERAEIEASGYTPENDAEAAIVRTLEPGPYTAIMRGNNDTTGVGLIEVYDLSGSSASMLSNMSTRGRVLTDDDVMIASTRRSFTRCFGRLASSGESSSSARQRVRGHETQARMFRRCCLSSGSDVCSTCQTISKSRPK